VMAEAASRGLAVAEYSPNQVKDAVAGHGGADKQQVQEMVRMLLELEAPPRPPDAADAAAVALTHVAHTGGLQAAAVLS
ncbi:MAG TPA: crossover junction endodeoxyribonuclease RuvC, partial [Microthrixaceae bacterium]|nr:crossover junction endodeoxyribonuclease RuvC [Microthrixaceae bacterium]